jgi:hypothetical protein
MSNVGGVGCGLDSVRRRNGMRAPSASDEVIVSCRFDVHGGESAGEYALEVKESGSHGNRRGIISAHFENRGCRLECNTGQSIDWSFC